MNNSRSPITSNYEIVQQEQYAREIRQLVNSHYHLIDPSARMFDAHYNDLVEQKNFTKEIATILSVSEDEAHNQITNVTQSWSIFWWLVTAILNSNFNREISGQPVINYNHLRSIIQTEKNAQNEIQAKLDKTYATLQEFMQKWTALHQSMIITMLATLKDYCLIVINKWEEEGKKATVNTIQFLKSNNTHDKIVEYWLTLHVYYEEELWKYHLYPNEISEIFCACMYNTYFYDDSFYKVIVEKYNTWIIDVIHWIVSKRNEYEYILWDEDWYDNMVWNIGIITYNMNIISYAIAEIIVEKIDTLLNMNQVAIIPWTIQSLDSKLAIIAESLSYIEQQKFPPTNEQLTLLKSMMYQSYEMSNYHFTQLVQYLYSKYLHPTKSLLKHSMTDFLHNELKKYWVNLSREIIVNEQWDMEF